MGNMESHDYFLGLDIGTNSVGWAVTDENYELLKANRKTLWGVRKFETAKTAEERRVFRSARRRHLRKLKRLSLLQEIFETEIAKVDPDFYLRLSQSSLHQDDRVNNFRSTLFNSSDFKDGDYYKKYPTIFHLRSKLIHDRGYKPDIRELYLALHHILKNRGHFLFKGENINSISSINVLLEDLSNSLLEALGLVMSLNKSKEEIGDALKIRGKNEKRRVLRELLNISEDEDFFGDSKRSISELFKALSGSVFKLSILFSKEEYDSLDKDKIEFEREEDFEALHNNLEQFLTEEEHDLIRVLESIFNWVRLSEVLGGEKYISDSMVKSYKEHKEDLRQLKGVVKKYSPHSYNKAFKSLEEKDNYAHYVGKGSKNGKKIRLLIKGKSTQEEVCKYFLKILTPFAEKNDPTLQAVLEKLKTHKSLPKLRTRDNRVIPYQLHLNELKEILINAQNIFPFLSIPDEDGFSPIEKIKSIMRFRIPYYVGPLNDYHMVEDGKEGFVWMVRNKGEEGPIYPWNFEQVVDLQESAEKFIRRMTNKCTYLYEEDVLPKDSLLYSKYLVLNELNNVKINREPISVELKNNIYDNFFLKTGKRNITLKQLERYLVANNFVDKAMDFEISGVDVSFKSSLKSWFDFTNILESGILTEPEIESIINWKALYGDDDEILESKIAKEYGRKLTGESIGQIVSLVKSYKGWGRLSKKLLVEIFHEDKATGEALSIVSMMEQTNNNLMELLSSKFDYLKEIDEINKSQFKEVSFSYDNIVAPLSISPAVKRQSWQTLLIVREINKIMGRAPKKVFVEVARGKGKKERTKSRKTALDELYKQCKDDIEFKSHLIPSLESKVDSDLRNDRLYLYYTQMGKCLYSGEAINLSDINNNSLYDIDHIYPQSLIKDDSLNNRVLVKAKFNADKGNKYPINYEWQSKMLPLWNKLLDKGLITKEKYFRLSRRTELTDEELFSFINRQLVETRQSTKVVISILKSIFEESGTEIVYSKAGNTVNFRNDFEIKKSRLVNDHHHAHDAYLNIVVGNAYNTKFTKNARIFIKELREKEHSFFNIRKLFYQDIIRGDDVAWVADENINQNDRTKKENRVQETGTIVTVRKSLNNHQVLVTEQATVGSGELFNLQPLKKKKGLIPLKDGIKEFLDTEKYGGYNSRKVGYFFIVDHTHGKERIRQILTVPIMFMERIEDNEERLLNFCKVNLNLIDPKIVVPKILIRTMIKRNGLLMCIRGITGNRIGGHQCHQLILDNKSYDYLGEIEKFVGILENRREGIIDSDALILATNLGITNKNNNELYKLLLKKESNTIYKKRPANQSVFLKSKKDYFKELPIFSQAKILMEVLNLFTATVVESDFRLLGGKSRCGNVVFSNVITKSQNFTILNTSPTGVFIKEIRINEL